MLKTTFFGSESKKNMGIYTFFDIQTYRVSEDFQIDLNEEFEMEWYPTELRLNQFELVYLFAYQYPK